MELSLRLAALRRLLFIVVGLLSVFGLCAELAENVYAWPDPYDFVDFFSLSYEENLPTWYSVTIIFSSGVILALIALSKRRERAPYVVQWWLLSITFLYLSLDELAQLHEVMTEWLDLEGILYFSWVIPAAMLLAVWLAVFVFFLGHLPARTRNRFLLAGTLYVFGALVLELPLGWWKDQHGDENFGYALIDWVEETLEIGAMSLFFYSLMDYLAAPQQTLRIALRGAPAD